MCPAIPPSNLGRESAEWGRSVDDRLREVERVAKRATTNLAAVSQKASGTTQRAITVGTALTATQADLTDKSRIPAAPTGLTLTSEGKWDVNGKAIASLTAEWDAVTSTIDNDPMDVASYEVWLKKASGDFLRLSATSDTFLSADVDAGTVYTVKVRAQGQLGYQGAFSDETQITTAIPLDVLPKPSAPILSTKHGTVKVQWDGKLSDDTGPIAPPRQFSFVYAAVADTETGTYTNVGTNLGIAGSAVATGLTVGSTHWFKFYAVDSRGVTSPPSDAVSIVVEGVNVDDFSDDTKTYIQENGGNLITYSVSAPLSTDAGKEGDTWFQRDATTGNIIGQWSHTGGAWVAQELSHEVIASVDLGKATVGELDGVHIKGKSILAGTLAARSIEADDVDFGAVQAEHIALGAALPYGTPTNRIPAPLQDTTYWGKVVDGTIVLSTTGAQPSGTIANGGLRMEIVSPAIRADMPVTALLMVPTSRKIYISRLINGGSVQTYVRQYDATGAQILVSNVIPPAPLSGETIVTLLDTAVTYKVEFNLTPPQTAMRVLDAKVFEVIGGASGQQRAELSPAGLRLVSDDGSGAVNLTTSSDMFLSIQKDTGLGFETQAAIDQDGTGTFNTVVSNGDFNALGSDVVGGFADAVINGQVRDGALFDRIPWGGVVEADCGNTAYAGTAARIGVGYGTVDLSADRRYVFDVAWRLFNAFRDGTSAGGSFLDFYVSTSPIDIGAPAQTGGFYYTQQLLWSSNAAAGDAFTTVSSDGVQTPAFTPNASGKFYVLVLLRNTSTRTMYFEPTSGTTLRISDVGSASTVLNVGSWETRATSGTVVPPTPPSTTITRTMNWSRAWSNSGTVIVTGSTQYFDKAMLYQGIGSTPYGARAGWPPLGISGRQITACSVWLQNRHTESSAGVTAHLGFGGNTTAPATFGTRTGAFDVPFSKGQGKWVPVPSAYWNSIAAGAYRDLSIGVSSGGTDYSYFDGVGKTSPPQIRITYR